jgi:hypothetical protein
MLLFYPVPRSSFLHWMLGHNFEMLIKYHKCALGFKDTCMAAIPMIEREPSAGALAGGLATGS